MNRNQGSRLFRLASRLLKYFLLALFGLAIAYVVSITFGVVNIALILPLVFDWVGRLGLILFCLIAITVIFESLR
ncbi:hypothetical protein [Scytonema sp. PCC 10023]|uniref:hypothetical protein n=1 Tax=Scytonema sp. PCC 10023 TaxID=1680591 RepID=UPI0039C6465E